MIFFEEKYEKHARWVQIQGTPESENVPEVKGITNNVKSLMHYLWLQIEAGGELEEVKKRGIDWASLHLNWIENEWIRKQREV